MTDAEDRDGRRDGDDDGDVGVGLRAVKQVLAAVRADLRRSNEREVRRESDDHRKGESPSDATARSTDGGTDDDVGG